MKRSLTSVLLVAFLFALSGFFIPASAATDFPSSERLAEVPASALWRWQHTGVEPYQGDLDLIACQMIGLSPGECSEFNAKFAAGNCSLQAMPNGTRVDAMLFTDANGIHRVRNDIDVDLQDPTTRDAYVCNLSTGKIGVIPVACSNYSVIEPAPRPAETVTVWKLCDCAPPDEYFANRTPSASGIYLSQGWKGGSHRSIGLSDLNSRSPIRGGQHHCDCQ